MKSKLRVAQLMLTTTAVAHGLSSSLLGRRDCLDLLSLLPLTTISTMSTSPSSSSSPTAATTTFPTMPNVPITDKVFFDVRVARQDGSTYVRDDLPDTFENRVLTARIVFGLYGTLTPNHVEQFLKYIVPPQDDKGDESTVENPYPSYSRSTFTALDQETGLLQGGYIPSLRVTDIGGSTALTYGSRVLPASLWIDKLSLSLVSSSSSSSTSTSTTTNGGTSKNNNSGRLSHSVPGLLTHKKLDVTPSFGVTTRAAPELDATHTVFGQVLWDETTLSWFRQLQDIPTYSIERAVGYEDEKFNSGGMATAVFNAQREFFRGAAKAAGDTRVSKLYPGKLLRRIEVMQVGKL